MTDLELTVFSAMHLHYEIDMLVRVAERPLGLRGQPIYTVDRNALVESYAIHLRNLIDFLYASPKGDDVGAVHYVRDVARWGAALGPMPAVLTEARERVGKQIAHLTRRRFEDGAAEKTWHPETEIPAITKSLKLFIEHSDPMKLHSVVTARVEWLPDLWMRGDSTE
jgi:hypothetical protein